MDIWQALVLAIVQGLTEFLPVSSSAHLILTSRLLGWADQGLGFDVAVHAGTLLAVILYFRDDLLRMIRPGDREARRLLLYVAGATVPLLVAGWLAADLVETAARNTRLIAVASILFGLLLGVADRYGARARVLGNLRPRDALAAGLAQALALIPGTSRSGITITAGLALGLTRQAAARFAFLLSLPAIAAATGYELLTTGGAVTRISIDVNVLVGFLAAGLTAYLTIGWFLRFLTRHGMMPFVVYRVVLGLVILVGGV